MAITVKVKVDKLTVQGEYTRVDFGPNYQDGEINKEWSYYTPSLDYHMNVRNEVAEKNFKVGQTFTGTLVPDEE